MTKYFGAATFTSTETTHQREATGQVEDYLVLDMSSAGASACVRTPRAESLEGLNSLSGDDERAGGVH